MPYARLKPVNERKGHRVQVYMIEGARFIAERGWYQVSDSLADKLRELHQEHSDEDSAFLFDVSDTFEQTQKIDEKEKQAQLNARLSLRRNVGHVTQPLPVNNAGGIEDLVRSQGGDTTTIDLQKNINGTQPTGTGGTPPAEEDDADKERREARTARTAEERDSEAEHNSSEVGRTTGEPRNRQKRR